MTKHRLTHIFSSIKAIPNIVPVPDRLDQLDTFYIRLIYVFKLHILSEIGHHKDGRLWYKYFFSIASTVVYLSRVYFRLFATGSYLRNEHKYLFCQKSNFDKID